jgi:hypothetical protein
MSSKSPIEMLSISAFVRMLGNSPEIYLFAVSSYHPLFPKIANLKLKCKVEIIYRHCHNEYLELADFLFSYEGHDLGELISLLREFIRPISTRAEDQLTSSPALRKSLAGNNRCQFLCLVRREVAGLCVPTLSHKSFPSATNPTLPNPLRSVLSAPQPAENATFAAETSALAHAAEGVISFSAGRYSLNLWSS